MTKLDDVVEKITERAAASEGIYGAFDQMGTGLHARPLNRWFTQRVGSSLGSYAQKAFGAALTVAMLAVEADRITRREILAAPPAGAWVKDADWQATVQRQFDERVGGLPDTGQPREVPTAWRKTPMQALLGREWLPGEPSPRWHLSLAHLDRVPTWQELVDAAHNLRPGVVFTIGLPPRSWWLNVDDRVLHCWEIRDEKLIDAWRAIGQGRPDRPS